MHKIYLRQALITCGFSRVLRHSNSNNTFISIVFVFLGHPVQGESKKTDTFDIQMNNKGVSFF